MKRDRTLHKAALVALTLPILYVLSSGPVAGATTLYFKKMQNSREGISSHTIWNVNLGLLYFYFPLFYISEKAGQGDTVWWYFQLFGYEFPMPA